MQAALQGAHPSLLCAPSSSSASASSGSASPVAYLPSPPPPAEGDSSSHDFRLSSELYNLVRPPADGSGEPVFEPLACPHTHRHAAPLTDRTLDTYQEAFQCVLALFARHQPGPWVPPRAFAEQAVHLCDVHTCPMVNHREVYVCLVSGRVHHCGDSVCVFGSEHGANLPACPVTHRPFTAECTQVYTQGYEDGLRSGEQLRMARVETEAERRAPTFKQRTSDRRLRTRKALHEAAPVSAVDAFAQSSAERRAEHAHETALLMRKFLRPGSALHQNLDRLHILAAFADRVHQQLRATSTPARDYTRQFHAFAMLYSMARGEGLCCNDRVLVPHEEDVAAALLPEDDCMRVLRLARNAGLRFLNEQLKFIRNSMKQ